MPGSDTGVVSPLILHASCVAFDGDAILIRGASGSGKSTLALSLMALGAALVSDDRTALTCQEDIVVAKAPETISGLIEARGIGVLAAQPAPPTPVRVIVDLDQTETERLPERKHQNLLGISLPLLHKVDSAGFPAALRQYLVGGTWKQT